MCTVTYLPLSTGSFILTHSRDEAAARPPAHPPQTNVFGGHTVLFPQDTKGLGTWIAQSNTQVVCLLNGAFVAHQPRPPYCHSRGLVIPHFFGYASLEDFAAGYAFSGIEPFTLLVAETGRLTELRWNGNRLFLHEQDPNRPHIWSSVTLYNPAVVAKREGWFRDWLAKTPTPSVADVRHFHQTAGADDPENGLRMNRQNRLLTLSLTSVVHPGNAADAQPATMIYEDFILQTRHEYTLAHQIDA